MRSENKHHISLEQISSDFERIEVIGADALLAACNAWGSIGDLPTDVAVELHRKIEDLRQIVESNAMLKEASRHLVSDLIRELDNRQDQFVLRFPLIDQLRTAVRYSQRVADLIAAERHVGRSRGIS